MSLELVKLDNATLPGIANAIRAKTGGTAPIVPAEMPVEIDGIRNIRMQSGVVTIDADATAITIPAIGRSIDIISNDVPLTTGYVVSASWNNGPTIGSPYSLGSYIRFTSSTGGTTPNGSTCAALAVTVSGETTTFNTTNSARLFAAGAKYCWVAYDWGCGDIAAVYDVSATAADDVHLLLIGNGNGTYTARISGNGATKNFAKGAEKPWVNYIAAITDIHIDAGVTSIGDYLFDTHERVKRIVFENSSKITHLGARAFRRCQFGGELSFSGLSDTTIGNAFAACINIRGITLPETVTAIGDGAFSGCLNLRYIHGVSNAASVGAEALEYTPRLSDIDIDPGVCTGVGASACIVSNALKNAELSDWGNTTFGDNAIPASNFSADNLKAIRAVQLPNVPARSVNADVTYKYAAVPFCIAYDGSQQMLSDGCMAASMYHIYNWINGAPYQNLLEWWNAKILSVFPDIATTISYLEVEEKIAEALGWKRRSGYPLYINSNGDKDAPVVKQNAVAAKKAIVKELSAGRPVTMSFKVAGSYYHTVAIIGADAVTDELIIADSIRLSGSKGAIYKIPFECIASNNLFGCIKAYDF